LVLVEYTNLERFETWDGWTGLFKVTTFIIKYIYSNPLYNFFLEKLSTNLFKLTINLSWMFFPLVPIHGDLKKTEPSTPGPWNPDDRPRP
jgi:hypothetical protein